MHRTTDGITATLSLAIIYSQYTFKSLKPPLRVAKKLGAGLLEAFYPTIENVNNGLVQRNSPAYSGEAAALPPAGTSVKR
jgi:hypothetical protein